MTDAKTLNAEAIEQAFEAMEWSWLRDKHGWYLIRMAADDEHGNLMTEYRISVLEDVENALVMRLCGATWFAGVPEAVRDACNEWNGSTFYPKAALMIDEESDSQLFIEWAIPCWDAPISQELVTGWIDLFRTGCASFLSRYGDAISNAPRFVAEPASSATH